MFSYYFPICLCLVSTIFSLAASSDASTSYWLTTDLLSIEWKKGCLTTAFCHEPKFQLIHTLASPSRENVQINWPVTEDIVQVDYLIFCQQHVSAQLFLQNQKIAAKLGVKLDTSE